MKKRIIIALLVIFCFPKSISEKQIHEKNLVHTVSLVNEVWLPAYLGMLSKYGIPYQSHIDHLRMILHPGQKPQLEIWLEGNRGQSPDSVIVFDDIEYIDRGQELYVAIPP